MMMDMTAYSTKKTFEGVVNNLERRYLETDSEWKREEISQYQSETACEKCKGMRLKDEALCVKINSLNISEVTEKSIDDAQKWFENLQNVLTERENKIAQHILKEINERLNFLLNVGLNYLTLIKRVRYVIWWRSTKNKISFSNRFRFNRCFICIR